jgi:hypothetical protein
MDMMNYGNANTNYLTTEQWLANNKDSSVLDLGNKTIVNDILKSNAGNGRANAFAGVDDFAFVVVGGAAIVLIAAHQAAKDGNLNLAEIGNNITNSFTALGERIGLIETYPADPEAEKGLYLPTPANEPKKSDNIISDPATPGLNDPQIETYPASELSKGTIYTFPGEVVNEPIILNASQETNENPIVYGSNQALTTIGESAKFNLAGNVIQPDGFKVTNINSPHEVNSGLFKQGYTDPPYATNSGVLDITLTQKTSFDRYYTKNIGGQFVAPLNSLDGLSASQIQNKLALPTTPQYKATATFESGTNLRLGIVNENYGFEGGELQLDLKGQIIGDFKPNGAIK